LEATSIHGTIVQMMVFTQFHFNTDRTDIAKHRDAYNHTVARQVDDFRDFINLHYVTERQDTAFWRAVKADFILPQVREKLALWQAHMPRHDDFQPFPGRLPHVEEQLYYPVLDGLGLLERKLAKSEMDALPKVRAHARKTADSMIKEYKRAAAQAPGHRAFLDANAA
jgi:tryptophan halogenase